MKKLSLTTPLDPKGSPITGWTRQHWEEVFFNLMKGIVDSASPAGARQRIPGPRSHHGLLADELEAPEPRTFQYMLHAQAAFEVEEPAQRLMLDRGRAGVAVEYVAARPLKMRQWTGYDPEPDHKYLASVGNPGIPPQWHVEAAAEPAASAFTLTLMRVFRDGRRPSDAPRIERSGSTLRVRVTSAGGEEVAFTFGKPGAREFAAVRRGARQWSISRAE